MASSAGPPILPLLKRRAPTSSCAFLAKEKRSRRRPLNMAGREDADVLAQDAGACPGNSPVEWRTSAQRSRDRVRKRAFYRGWRCAMGLPGLLAEDYGRLEHHAPYDDNGELLLHSKPSESFVPADEDRHHGLEVPYEGPHGHVPELRSCVYNIEDELSANTDRRGNISRESDDAECSREDTISGDLLGNVDRHCAHIDEGMDLEAEDFRDPVDTYLCTPSVKGEHDSVLGMDFGDEQCNANLRGHSCSGNLSSSELNKQVTAQVEGLFDHLQYADTFFNIVEAVRLYVVSRTCQTAVVQLWDQPRSTWSEVTDDLAERLTGFDAMLREVAADDPPTHRTTRACKKEPRRAQRQAQAHSGITVQVA
mmetsp:Transcript_23681/g.80087  ORF Transcript_23681/g.80087 Transcript_23681/m.80087 type:complete len:366 (-) Transcript_23681:406-1503(-)|eukprot:CAMPEP_0203856204 /NCGR_PEP_ID=MMETSP0359-20131031/10050_1 /ASSEMBLY_ACC=CAM_ASM_000338 /TAXON_ID=268821 /ORGANISM="Scrippsiella Hangoei, Strain SHTV-5" /LENGTH=365 /DNA_ID=CAMNT_0050772797 /DNA_START=29 /DNA_END=1126 /DNA_ORIENTATION=+